MNTDDDLGTNDDSELMRRCATDRDEAAFDVLAERYREPLRRYLRGLVGDFATADDVLQETLLRLWTHAGSFDGRGPMKAWLFRIAANLASNHRRSAARRHESPLMPGRATAAGDADDEVRIPSWMIDRASITPESAAIAADERARLGALLGQLPEESRGLLHLVYDDDVDLRTAASHLGIPEGTVKSRLYHARKRLARAWRQQRDDDNLEGRLL